MFGTFKQTPFQKNQTFKNTVSQDGTIRRKIKIFTGVSVSLSQSIVGLCRIGRLGSLAARESRGRRDKYSPLPPKNEVLASSN
jgi:hypothetical protein